MLYICNVFSIKIIWLKTSKKNCHNTDIFFLFTSKIFMAGAEPKLRNQTVLYNTSWDVLVYPYKYETYESRNLFIYKLISCI